jgi:hypothetical protein
MHQGELALDDDGIVAIGSEAGEAGEDAAIAASGAEASDAALAVGMAAGVSVVALDAGAADIEASSAFLPQAPSVSNGRASARQSAPCRHDGMLLDDARNGTDSFDMKFSWSRVRQNAGHSKKRDHPRAAQVPLQAHALSGCRPTPTKSAWTSNDDKYRNRPHLHRHENLAAPRVLHVSGFAQSDQKGPVDRLFPLETPHVH